MVNPLARVVMSNLTKNKEDSTPYREQGSFGNLSSREVELLKGLIKGNKQVENYTSKGNVVTLDQAVDMVKKNL
ncbi:hypothetical protein [Tepidimicrobium xylanilyticum]